MSAMNDELIQLARSNPPDWIAVAAFIAVMAALGCIIVALFFDEDP